ncbi:cyclin-A1 [Archocentrus centrarchus]|uniref:cyclin-A1 n=1 Tax=Archocentrus centrarchus TaxID=63155 RepID=UPI0011EA45FE|nr:cyclin-A1 [Archocentrus centrarchus]XP_030602629.1 cyclin-A1 [Archocentrus centrarchus]
MMNMGTNAYHGSHTSKENMAPSTRIDAVQVQRTKKRTVLGVLSENEQRGRSVSQGSQFSKHSSVSDGSQVNCFSFPSSSSYDVYVEEACEVVLTASGEEIVGDSYYQDAETDALQTEDIRRLLELSSSSCQDASQQSESEEVFSVDYAEDIHQHLRENEMKFRPRPDYLQRHPEVTNGMRVILVDWLVEVVQEFRLHTETLHLAVNYLDRFLSCTAYVTRSKLQLVGTAALLIAAKYEETSPPELNQFVYITDNTYTKKQLVRMEHAFLTLLGFNLAAPTTNQFLHLFMAIHSVCANTKNLALYIAELSLLEIDPFLQYTPSIVAAGAYCLATYTINNSLWPDSLNAFTGYTMAEIWPCLADLHKLLISAENRPQQAVREKYKSAKYCGVSWINPPAGLPCP